MRKIILGLSLAATSFVSPMLLSGSASAANIPRNNCTVTSVSFEQYGSTGSNGPTLNFTCASDSTVYGTYFGVPACGFYAGPSLDVIKAWQGVLQAALLSGRPVDFQKDTSCAAGSYTAQLVNNVKIH